MSDEYETSMSVPLDTEGFLRRECLTCEREFKWLPSQQDSDAEDHDDMRRVDFTCHSSEPVKVLDAWTGQVHCLICGQPAS